MIVRILRYGLALHRLGTTEDKEMEGTSKNEMLLKERTFRYYSLLAETV